MKPKYGAAEAAKHNLKEYPLNKSPIIPGSAKPDAEWLMVARSHSIFNKTPTDGAIQLKLEHLQLFWDQLDRHNRNDKDGLWRVMLLNSPWWDCPDFKDLLKEPKKGADGKPVRGADDEVVMVHRDFRRPSAEREFFDRWWQLSKLPMRRFKNGNVLIPRRVEHYKRFYGEEGMVWPHMRETVDEKEKEKWIRKDEAVDAPVGDRQDEAADDPFGDRQDEAAVVPPGDRQFEAANIPSGDRQDEDDAPLIVEEEPKPEDYWFNQDYDLNRMIWGGDVEQTETTAEGERDNVPLDDESELDWAFLLVHGRLPY
ncbi:hypothetical protein G7046_g1198 [Stylonectria norvegica]|nr:hypothetical protein G7046_g1198 [Stylonectria norvegica]